MKIERLLAAALLLAPAVRAQVDVLTVNYDLDRANENLNETLLTPSNVNPRQFGKLFSFEVDGQVYAQPLYLHGLSLTSGATRNVLFVATMHNSVYAFDADGASGLAPLWQANFGPPVNPLDFVDPEEGPFSDIQNEIGILGTPVIDPATSTLYAVNYTGSNGSYAYYIHALDLVTGDEKFGGPVEIQGSLAGSGWGGLEQPVNGQLPFLAADHLQRPGLLLLGGMVYAGFGSHGDMAPWHGWLFGYAAGDLTQPPTIFNATAQDAGGAIWQSGHGLASDGQSIFLASGNGTYDSTHPAWSQSVLRLTANGTPSVADWFTPSEWDTLNSNDNDVGSNGPVMIPGTNLLYLVAKEGQLFLLDRGNLGQEVASNTQTVQSFPVVDPSITFSYRQNNGFFVFNTALWDNPGGPLLFVWPLNESLRAFRFTNGLFETTPAAENTTVPNAVPFSGFSVSGNDATPGTAILWATSATNANLPAPGTLHAFDAANIATELWNSDQSGARDTMGNFTKFANPTVANGKVYAPTSSNQIAVYGLLPGVAGVTTVVNGASFLGGGVAGGELITIFGDSIGASPPVAATPSASGFGASLGGISVDFDGKPAPLLYVSSTQVNAVVPFALAGPSTTMTLHAPGGASYAVKLAVNATSAALFSQGSSGRGQGAILNAPNFSRNSPSNPAARGSSVSLFLTGAGPYTPALADGALAPVLHTPLVELPISVTIGGVAATVTYQGAAPGLVAGLTQVNVTVPESVTPGPAVPVSLVAGTSPAGNIVTMAVK